MSKGLDQANAMLDANFQKRLAWLQARECPICKVAGQWHMVREAHMLARSNGVVNVSSGNAQHGLMATNADQAYTAECTSCGFVAHFAVGRGPGGGQISAL